jgi:hypothetical protein
MSQAETPPRTIYVLGSFVVGGFLSMLPLTIPSAFLPATNPHSLDSTTAMGDPFWRRFSASRDNNNRSAGPPPPHYSRERTLATEYTSLNTRTSASAETTTAAGSATTTASRRSRNDLFETDWGWKGDTKHRSAAVAGEGNVLRGLGIMVPTSTADLNRVSEDERTALCNDVPTSVEPLSPRQHPSDHLSLFTSEPVLGAPIQLQSTPPIHQQHQPSDHHLDLQLPLRSRNDAIYNVNYLTVTPPRFNTPPPPPLPVSTAAFGGKKPPQQLDLGPGLSLPANTASYHRSSSHLAESDVVRLSPLSKTTGNSPASDTSVTFPCKRDYQINNTLDGDTRPTRSATFASASSSSGSSTSNCSGITSFADHTVQQHSETRPTHGRVSTGSANTEQPRYGTTLSPSVSPITSVSPDTHFSPAFTSSFSSFTPTTDDKKAIQQQVGIHSSPSARIMMTPTSPSSEVSLSRTSSMTIVQSPSTALANITRKADRLLVPDDNADNDDDDDGDVEGRDAEAARESGAGVARVRADIVSRQWLVGYGRYAKVYLGAFKTALPSLTTISSPTTPSTWQGGEVSPSPPIQTSTGWSLCAAKVFDNDIESISMANRESAMLGYLQEDLPSTRLRPETLVRSGMRESEEGDRGEEGGGRRYILSRIALVDENIIEPPPSFATATPGDLSRINSQRASRTSTDTHMVCRSPTDNLPGTTTTTTTTMVTPNKATDAISSGPHIRTVHGVHRRGHGKGLGYSHAASETTAILRQLGKTAIAAKSSTDAFLSEGGTDLAPSHRPVLLLPFYANGSMATFLKTREEPVDEELWMNWFEQGLRALSWCKKKGILHNDIKVGSCFNSCVSTLRSRLPFPSR